MIYYCVRKNKIEFCIKLYFYDVATNEFEWRMFFTIFDSWFSYVDASVIFAFKQITKLNWIGTGTTSDFKYCLYIGFRLKIFDKIGKCCKFDSQIYKGKLR